MARNSLHLAPAASFVPRRALIAFITAVVLATLGLAPGAAEDASGPPRGVHLSLTADPMTTLTVMWFTDGVSDPGTLVEYGPTPALGQVVTGDSWQSMGVDVTAHEATMTGLAPGSDVHYRVGSPAAWSDVFQTHTAPPAGEPFRFVVFGDHGVSEAAVRTTDFIASMDVDFALIAGDVSYAEEDHHEWDLYFDDAQRFAARVPYMAAIGNHGFIADGGSRDWRERLAMPGNELYWSFDYGNAHFLALQSDFDWAVAEGIVVEMMQFADADLADAAARREAGLIDHVFVVQHHPLYSHTERGPGGLDRRLQADQVVTVEQLLHRYDVKMLLVGHNHNYERTRPMVAMVPTTLEEDDYVDPVGFIELITGGAGRGLYDFVHPDDFLPYSAAHAKRHHVVQIDVEGPTLQVQALSTDQRTGDVLDSFTLSVS